MPNQYFQFKQFKINQDKTAMKVCTDACILGAWTAKKMTGSTPQHILDIGAGTGLLSLMLAQKSGAVIDAVELNEDAAQQAIENAAGSPWAQQVQVFNERIQDFNAGYQYGLIISNPPFFEEDLKSNVQSKNLAKHSIELIMSDLIESIKRMLLTGGHGFILIPFHRKTSISALVAANGLVIKSSLDIKQTAAHTFFRTILECTNVPCEKLQEDVLVIHDAERNYTPAFTDLLKDYYLKL